MDPAVIRSLLTDLLDVAVAALTPSDEDDPRTTPPPSQYVAHGAWAWDCEAVVVHLVRLALERPGTRTGSGCAVMPAATLAATVLRCYPGLGDGGTGSVVPSREEIDAAASVLAVDAAALAGGIADAWASGDLFASAGIGCGQVTIVPGVEPLGPAGGLAGWRVTLDVRF